MALEAPPGAGSPSYRWAILAVGVVAQASFSAVFFGLPILAPALRSEFDLSLGRLGVALATVSTGMLVTVLPWGVLADRVGERIVMSAGLGLAAVSLGVAASVEGFPALLYALTAAGAFGACVQAASGRAVLAWFSVTERGMALGIRQTAVVVGGAWAALVLPPVTAAGGVRASLLVLAGGALVASLASGLALRDPPGRGARVPTPLGAALHDHYLWRLSAGSALLVVAQISVLGFAVLFLHDERGLSTAAAAGVVALMQVLGGVLRIASGHWSDRIGTRIAPLLRLGGALAAALAFSALVVDAPLAVLLPALVLAGSLSAGWNGLSFTAAAELAGQARAGAAIGLQQASLALAAAATPVVFAAILDQTSWAVAFGFAGAVALAGTLALVPLAAREPVVEARR